MVARFAQILALVFTAVSLTNAATYGVKESISGTGFLNSFNHEAIAVRFGSEFFRLPTKCSDAVRIPHTDVSGMFLSATDVFHLTDLYLSSYVDQSTALAKNLTFASGNTFIIRTDFTSTLSASGPGRDSVRLQSKAQYDTHVVT